MSSTILPDQPVTRELVLLGEETPGRRGDKSIVAESRCEITLTTNEALERCVEALRASDERLAQQPTSRYDWRRTWVERSSAGGGKVLFNVAWYDTEFFDEKKDTFLKPDHLAMYAHIGADEGSVSVSHWRLVS
ncbi:hypothetical protein [Streptomyces sp. URMC 124]|uniref:hypothetical protein n=1 Tax=Streptomyces sp. URMC 124 TaxID=3423405 RepID=UPI003F1D6B07